MRKTKKLLKKFAWMASGEIGGKGALFIAQLLLAQRMSIADFGRFSLVFAVINFGWMMVNFGSGLFGTREIARSSGDRDMQLDIVSGVVSLRVILFIAFFLAVLLAAGFNLFGLELSAILVLMVLSVGFRSVMLDWYYKGHRDFEVIAMAMIAGFSVLLGIIYVYANGDLFHVGVAWVTAYFVMFVVYLMHFFWVKKARSLPTEFFSLRRVREVARKTRYFWLGGVANNLYQLLPILYISEVFSVYEVGMFSAVYKVSLGFVFVISLVPAFSYSYLSSLYGCESGSEFKVMSRALLLIVLIVAGLASMAIALYPDKMLLYGLGEKYAAGTGPLVVLAMYVLLRSLREAVYMIMSSANSQSVYAKLTLFLPVVWLASLLLIQVFRTDVVLASCWALVVSESILLVLLLCYLCVGKVCMSIGSGESVDNNGMCGR